MSSKNEVLYSVGVLNDSLSAVEQAVLGMEEEFHRHGNQQALLIGQGQAVTKSIGELVAAVGAHTERLNSYLDEQGGSGSLGARMTKLEGRVDRMGSHAGE
jgi:hypothetical protein